MYRGNPFIAIETLRALPDGIAGGPLPHDVPASIRDLIGSRISRLTDRARHLVQVASTVGHEFDFELLAAGAKLGPQAAGEGVEVVYRGLLAGKLPGGRQRKFLTNFSITYGLARC
jgi:hypothetical protein